MLRIKHIAVAGNIGAGKTTLTEMLARHYGWDVHFEDTTTKMCIRDSSCVSDAGTICP